MGSLRRKTRSALLISQDGRIPEQSLGIFDGRLNAFWLRRLNKGTAWF
jgi:hypothetical protein